MKFFPTIKFEVFAPISLSLRYMRLVRITLCFFILNCKTRSGASLHHIMKKVIITDCYKKKQISLLVIEEVDFTVTLIGYHF